MPAQLVLPMDTTILFRGFRMIRFPIYLLILSIRSRRPWYVYPYQLYVQPTN